MKTEKSTRQIASEIVQAIAERLPTVGSGVLDGIRSVYVCGSFVRGDWLERSSDLDLNVLFRPGDYEVEETPFGLRYLVAPECHPGYALLQATATEALGGEEFYSSCPGGIDWMAYPSPPTDEDVSRIQGSKYFNVFLFDLHQNHQTLWGEPPRHWLPHSRDPKELTEECFTATLARLASLPADRNDAAARLSYKLTLLAQVVLGEETLDKIRLLGLYRDHVPDFPEKAVGELLIRGYLGAVYPERPAHFESVDTYRGYCQALSDVVRQ